MGLRALVGVEDADGTFRARHVHYGGCPTLVIPVLTVLVHQTCHRDVTAAADWLLACDWRQLHIRPVDDTTAEVEGTPSDWSGEPESGRILERPAGDREWAYLFSGNRLHVYLAVFPETGPKRWQPWAGWPTDELPAVGADELLDVQRRGYWTQWRASDFRTYMTAVRERFGKGAR